MRRLLLLCSCINAAVLAFVSLRPPYATNQRTNSWTRSTEDTNKIVCISGVVGRQGGESNIRSLSTQLYILRRVRDKFVQFGQSFKYYQEEDDVEQFEDDQSIPVLTDDICLVPGDPIVRIEEAPGNARRIFTGIDINCDIQRVWSVLTNYEDLHQVIPSLAENEVVYRTARGARLSQVGAANVFPGVTFTAKTVLDVVTYLEDTPIPATMTADYITNSASDEDIRNFDKRLPLTRGVFPRPFAITALPCRDITMQNVPGEGDFDHYQGVWRMQPLPNCNTEGGDATRLTYGVEIKPRGPLPVRLIEGRIASDLKINLIAIRDHTQKLREEDVLLDDRNRRKGDEKNMVDDKTTLMLGGVISGITQAQDIEMQDLRFANKLLKQRIDHLESELEDREEIINRVRTLLGSRQAIAKNDKMQGEVNR